ncbi:MAG: BPL-N domain-containing protein [Promethearchaeota archaeon]
MATNIGIIKSLVLPQSREPEEMVKVTNIVSLLLKRGFDVFRVLKSFNAGSLNFKPGSYLIVANELEYKVFNILAEEFGVQWNEISEIPSIKALQLKSPRIAVYSDIGGETWVFVAIALNTVGFDFTLLSAKQIERGFLQEYDGVIFPGGDEVWTMRTLGKKARNEVVQFVNNGGGYIGICAGGFLAQKSTYVAYPSTKDFFGIANAKTPNTPPNVWNIGPIIQRIIKPNHPVMFGYSGFNEALFYGGPTFDAGEGVKVLATLHEIKAEGMVSSPEIYKKMKDNAEVVTTNYGQGKVVLFGSHPELAPDNNGMLHNTIFYVTSEETKLPRTTSKLSMKTLSEHILNELQNLMNQIRSIEDIGKSIVSKGWKYLDWFTFAFETLEMELQSDYSLSWIEETVKSLLTKYENIYKITVTTDNSAYIKLAQKNLNHTEWLLEKISAKQAIWSNISSEAKQAAKKMLKGMAQLNQLEEELERLEQEDMIEEAKWRNKNLDQLCDIVNKYGHDAHVDLLHMNKEIIETAIELEYILEQLKILEEISKN